MTAFHSYRADRIFDLVDMRASKSVSNLFGGPVYVVGNTIYNAVGDRLADMTDAEVLAAQQNEPPLSLKESGRSQ